MVVMVRGEEKVLVVGEKEEEKVVVVRGRRERGACGERKARRMLWQW